MRKSQARVGRLEVVEKRNPVLELVVTSQETTTTTDHYSLRKKYITIIFHNTCISKVVILKNVSTVTSFLTKGMSVYHKFYFAYKTN